MVLLTVALGGVLTGFVWLVWTGYQRRLTIYRLKQQGVPMPDDWSWIFGHLVAFGERAARMAPDANVLYATGSLSDELKSETYLLDLWPVAAPTLFTSDLDMANLITIKHNLPKNMLLRNGMLPIAGGPDLVSMNGSQWKFWRGVFNHGFSMLATTAQVPAIVDSVEIFCDLLRAKAKSGEVFIMEKMTRRLTMDVILKVTLDLDVDNQRTENPLSIALRTILDWHSFWDPRILLNPLRPFVQWYYGRVMNNVIINRLEELFAEMKSEDGSSSTATSTTTATRMGTKSVASLALKGYIEETTDKSLMQRDKLDRHFAKFTGYQARVFLFAGNDTTASTICWLYNTLSKQPEALAKLRAEHDALLGPDPSQAATLLRENPALVNKLEYTMAVIKETMRLDPVANTTRAGVAGLVLTDSAGHAVPTEGLNIVVNGPRIMRDGKYWPRVTEFLPERWLVGPGHELYIQNSKDTYRPFEIGPRSCIGQNLVFHELKIVLAMTARTFEVKPAYEEWDVMKRKKEGWMAGMMRSLGVKEAVKTADGERIYHKDSPGSSPSDNYPCRVTLT